MITNNAKGLISKIAFEVRLVDQRIAGGHLEQGQALGCILERLQAEAKRDVDMRIFLETMSYIPPMEDEDKSLPWAEDRREARTNVTTDRRDQREQNDTERCAPTPGERVC